MFAKLKTLLRNTQARMLETLWSAIGLLTDKFPVDECGRYIRCCGYLRLLPVGVKPLYQRLGAFEQGTQTPRTRVATLFPNSASCLRLVGSLLAEQDEEWMTAKIYLSMKS